MKNLIRNLAQRYDLTIFDSPPLGSVADAVALSTEVDGTLMVIRSGKTKRKVGLHGKESLESVNAEVIGAVLNNVDYAKQYGYYYYYHRYYGYYRYYSHDNEDDSE
jgi:Mrp family chromosome partitioning ATPase